MFTHSIDDELSLALIQPSFAKDYVELFKTNKDYLGEWLTFPHMPNAGTEAFFLTFIQESLTQYGKGKTLVCAMIYKGNIAGNISFNTIDHDRKCAEIGYWLDKASQGNGIVTRSVEKLIDIGFNDFNLTKIQIDCAVDNLSSRAIPESLGFKLEGIITQAECINGKIIDHAVYGLQQET